MKHVLLFLMVLLLLAVPTAGYAQTPSIPDEPASAAFINANFQLQSSYSGVLCVSGDGTCPAEVNIAVPCLVADCQNPAQTYPVSQTFDTIQAAAEAAQAGNLIIITPGRYRGVDIEETGGADGAYIHFLGWGDAGSVIIDTKAFDDRAWLRHHFYFIAAHHYIIQNLTFENAEDGAGIFISGYFSGTGQFSHHFIVMDVYSHDNGVWGLHTTAASYILIQDSIFTNSGEEHGAYISGSGDNMLIRRNVFQGNSASGLQVNADPQSATSEMFYWLAQSTGDTCGWTEEDAEFTGAATWQDMKDCYDSQGLPDLGAFIEDGISENLIIEQNVITANGELGGAGINLASVRNSIVQNNLVYGNSAAAIACWDNAYAEDKGLGSSDFGCQNVGIYNNTLVDETGGRGALILNNDAQNMIVHNNAIIRDRYDTYEVSVNSGTGLQSGNNYYTEQYIEDSDGFDGDVNSISGISVSEGLAQFVEPNFEPWILEDGVYPTLNPNRPDYRPFADSVLVTGGDPQFVPVLDAFGNIRAGTEIGAFVATSETGAGINEVAVSEPSKEDAPPAEPAAQNPASANPSVPTTPRQGTVVFTSNAQFYMRSAESVAVPQNISNLLDATSSGLDEWITISPDGQWLLMETERFHPDCVGWACFIISDVGLTAPSLITINGEILHATEFSAVASGGNMIVFPYDGGVHIRDIYSVTRIGEGWSSAVLLTANSPYQWNDVPVISDDGTRVLFDCGNEPYAAPGTAICEAATDGSSMRVVITPENVPSGYTNDNTALHGGDYAPDGSIFFEGNWSSNEQVWRLSVGMMEAVPFSPNLSNNNSPCVLPSGHVVSLWLGRDNSQYVHELTITEPDGSQSEVLLQNVDVTDIGIGCGG